MYKLANYTPLHLTGETVDHILRTYNAETLGLYVAYVAIAQWQKTDQVRASDSFMMKRMKWSENKFRKHKKELTSGGFIETISTKNESNKITGWYVKIHYLVAISESEQLVVPKGHNLIDQNGITITESTSENKQDTTTNKNKFTQEQLQTYMDTYNKALNRNSRLSNKKLQDKLNTRLQDYTFDEIIRSLENMFSKDFYKGKNDRNWTPTPSWILENNERLEQFLYIRPLKTKAPTTSEKFNELEDLENFTPDPL